MNENEIISAKGKLGVLVVGMNGAVSTTFIAGVYNILKNNSIPVGSLSQLGTIRIGNRAENNFPLIKDFVDLTDLGDLVFGGWDIDDKDCLETSLESKVLNEKDLIAVEDDLKKLRPMRAVFQQDYVKRINGEFIKKGETKYELMEQLREDIKNFKKENNLERIVMIWCGSTEIYIQQSEVHHSTDAFIKGMKENHQGISPSMLYAYASISEGVPYINGSPNLSTDIPALWKYAEEKNVPVAGKDFKTGQTLIKTVLAPMLKMRALGLSGWFSSNLLGNKDGEVLDDPGSFKTKEETKLSVLETILLPDLYPDLYSNYVHKVRINYYPPRGDNKEGWDNIDIFGWLGYPMQLKVNFLCRDSILAAPIVLDLVLFTDLAQRAGLSGIQEWLSFYFKSPMHSPGIVPEHDLSIQSMKLKNTLRQLQGEEPITHLDSNGV